MEVNTQPFNRTKSRKALKYKKITNQAREKLIEMVKFRIKIRFF
jgi:hypothetical protein